MVRPEVVAVAASAIGILATAIRAVTAKKPPVAGGPGGELELEVEVVYEYPEILAPEGGGAPTVRAVATVMATQGTLPITCEVQVVSTSVPEGLSETVTIEELNKPYSVEFTWSVEPGTREEVTAKATFKNKWGTYTAGPVSKTVEVPGLAPVGTVSIEVSVG